MRCVADCNNAALYCCMQYVDDWWRACGVHAYGRLDFFTAIEHTFKVPHDKCLHISCLVAIGGLLKAALLAQNSFFLY